MKIPVEVFLSHADEDKIIATEIAQELRSHGGHVFIAHVDIEPGANWKSVLTEKISECDVFVILLTQHFHKAEWTEQEVGIAHAFKKRMVPLRFDTTSTTGFMTDFQATQISYPIDSTELKNLFNVLVAYSDEGQRHVDEMINQLRSSGNFYEANAYARLLFENSKFTSEQINKIAESYISNYEIRGGFVSNPKCLELFQNNWKKIEPQYRDKIKLYDSTGS